MNREEYLYDLLLRLVQFGRMMGHGEPIHIHLLILLQQVLGHVLADVGYEIQFRIAPKARTVADDPLRAADRAEKREADEDGEGDAYIEEFLTGLGDGEDREGACEDHNEDLLEGLGDDDQVDEDATPYREWDEEDFADITPAQLIALGDEVMEACLAGPDEVDKLVKASRAYVARFRYRLCDLPHYSPN
jgi:hypothetical protein